MPGIMRLSKKSQHIAESIMGLPKNAPRKRYSSKKKEQKELNDTVQTRLSIEAGAII